jgi:hypothetical protein
MGRSRPWIIDDTGFPKQGRHSVGVARQYCGQLGKQDNCQVAVSLSIANRHASLPVAYRLYLPQEWTQGRERRRKAGIADRGRLRQQRGCRHRRSQGSLADPSCVTRTSNLAGGTNIRLVSANALSRIRSTQTRNAAPFRKGPASLRVGHMKSAMAKHALFTT